MIRAFIALGSNIEPERHLMDALRALDSKTRVMAVSPVYETPPEGASGTSPYLNAIVQVETDCSASDLITSILRPIEHDLGRTRGEDPNASRTIDLDLIFHGDAMQRDPAEHAFVAIPLADLAPDLRLPSGETASQIAARFGRERARFRRRDDVIYRKDRSQ